MASRKNSDRLLPVIGVFKLLKAASLILIGIGAHKLLGGNTSDTIEHWCNAIRIDQDSKIAHGLIAKVTNFSPMQLKAISAGTFIYGAIYLVEGIGLILRKRWAEFITLGTTLTFLPIEIYEIVKEPSAVHIGLLVANVLIMIYLVVQLRRKKD